MTARALRWRGGIIAAVVRAGASQPLRTLVYTAPGADGAAATGCAQRAPSRWSRATAQRLPAGALAAATITVVRALLQEAALGYGDALIRIWPHEPLERGWLPGSREGAAPAVDRFYDHPRGHLRSVQSGYRLDLRRGIGRDRQPYEHSTAKNTPCGRIFGHGFSVCCSFIGQHSRITVSKSIIFSAIRVKLNARCRGLRDPRPPRPPARSGSRPGPPAGSRGHRWRGTNAPGGAHPALPGPRR